MKTNISSVLYAIVIGLSSALIVGCDSSQTGGSAGDGKPPAPESGGAPVAHDIRPATAPIPQTDESVEEAYAILARNSQEIRDEWAGKSFEEFESKVYKEPFEGGKYIVSGDIAIADRKQLEDFFETSVRSAVTTQLVVNTSGGQDTIWSNTQKKQLTYCVSTTFGARHSKVVTDMGAATGAWKTVADVDFRYVGGEDGNCTAANANVLFDVRPVNVNGNYLARAFFPNDTRPNRNVLIDESSFQLPSGDKLQLVGILRHELGHALGWRHEHTRPESGKCFEDSNWRPLTGYDRFSVMHYPQCNGGGDWSLTLTNFDKNGAACVYGAAPGFPVDTNICPNAPTPQTTPCAPTVKTFSAQRVAKAEEKPYGPFTVNSGTVFTARMTGNPSPGDPDLYVRFGQAPGRTAGQFACRSWTSGANETCTLDVPAGQSRAFVMVHGYAAGSYDLVITHIGQP